MRMLKRLSAAMILLLLCSMAAVIPTALADGGDETSDKELKCEALLQLLNQTAERVNATLSFLNTTLGGIAPEAYERYEEALRLYENATRLREEGSYDEAIELGLKALHVFELCLKAAVAGGVEEAESYRALKAALLRLNATIEKAEKSRDMLIKVFPNLEANVTEAVDPLIEEAKQLAAEATQALESGNVTAAATIIGKAHADAAKALAAMNKIVNSEIVMALRIKHYIKSCFAGFAAGVRRRAGKLGVSLDDLLNSTEKELEDAVALTGEGHLGLAKAKILNVRARIQNMLRQLDQLEKQHRRNHEEEHSQGRGRHSRP